MIMDIVDRLNGRTDGTPNNEVFKLAKAEIQTLRAKVASAEALVEALRGAEAIVKSAILLEDEVEPYIPESVYELNGCLGENAANISVSGRGVLNKIKDTLATYDKLSEKDKG